MSIQKLVLALTIVPLASCATVARGTSEDVIINYSPSDAQVVTTLGHTCVASPCALSIERKKSFTVKASKTGFQSQSVFVDTTVSKKGAMGIAGNILLGGVGGLVVDGVTGAGRDHTPNPVNITLKQL